MNQQQPVWPGPHPKQTGRTTTSRPTQSSQYHTPPAQVVHQDAFPPDEASVHNTHLVAHQQLQRVIHYDDRLYSVERRLEELTALLSSPRYEETFRRSLTQFLDDNIKHGPQRHIEALFAHHEESIKRLITSYQEETDLKLRLIKTLLETQITHFTFVDGMKRRHSKSRCNPGDMSPDDLAGIGLDMTEHHSNI